MQEDEPKPESAVARLNLVVEEAYILTSPSTTTAPRHRSYCFHLKEIKYSFFSRCYKSLL